MSQLLVHPQTVVDEIPLTRRIKEIMSEKGGYYSIQAMAGRLGIHRETYRNMLNGDRAIYTFELQKIAQDLKITVERLTQEDWKKDAVEFRGLLESRQDPDRLLSLAEKLAQIAVGCTERCIALNYLGYAFFESKQFDKANSVLSKAFVLAESIVEKYGETELKYRITRNRMQNYIKLNDFSRALEISEQVEEVFDNEPIRLGELLYIRAMVTESQDKLDEARELYYKSLEYLIKANNRENIGRAYVNVAHIEYFTGNYDKSRQMLEKALVHFSHHLWSSCVAEKELAKTLIKLGQNDRAVEVIDSALEKAQKLGLKTIEAKLNILLACITGVVNQVIEMLENKNFDQSIRYLACKCVIGHYRKKGDAFNFMHYYEIAEKFKQTASSDILDDKEL